MHSSSGVNVRTVKSTGGFISPSCENMACAFRSKLSMLDVSEIGESGKRLKLRGVVGWGVEGWPFEGCGVRGACCAGVNGWGVRGSSCLTFTGGDSGVPGSWSGSEAGLLFCRLHRLFCTFSIRLLRSASPVQEDENTLTQDLDEV